MVRFPPRGSAVGVGGADVGAEVGEASPVATGWSGAPHAASSTSIVAATQTLALSNWNNCLRERGVWIDDDDLFTGKILLIAQEQQERARHLLMFRRKGIVQVQECVETGWCERSTWNVLYSTHDDRLSPTAWL